MVANFWENFFPNREIAAEVFLQNNNSLFSLAIMPRHGFEFVFALFKIWKFLRFGSPPHSPLLFPLPFVLYHLSSDLEMLLSFWNFTFFMLLFSHWSMREGNFLKTIIHINAPRKTIIAAIFVSNLRIFNSQLGLNQKNLLTLNFISRTFLKFIIIDVNNFFSFRLNRVPARASYLFDFKNDQRGPPT